VGGSSARFFLALILVLLGFTYLILDSPFRAIETTGAAQGTTASSLSMLKHRFEKDDDANSVLEIYIEDASVTFSCGCPRWSANDAGSMRDKLSRSLSDACVECFRFLVDSLRWKYS
jgi:hypothetical protein